MWREKKAILSAWRREINTKDKMNFFTGLMACLCHKLQLIQRKAAFSIYYFCLSVFKSL